ncbi:Transcription factor [Kickxella alabastrina]|uniref:Transcription factor n=1 Tax=Kickxella alabastrina TaxID=61397 RepID=A0ACC1IJI7_9FUNG|nr:Transcription factor [Kickxella alabastrina]
MNPSTADTANSRSNDTHEQPTVTTPTEPTSFRGTPTDTKAESSLPNTTNGAKKAERVTRVTKKKGELLTENEKKANHIASEQKRRQNIRVGYDQLIQIVPTLTPSQRSEALILQKTVEYIKYLLMEREILEGQLDDVSR